jgi:hypothetical protein
MAKDPNSVKLIVFPLVFESIKEGYKVKGFS